MIKASVITLHNVNNYGSALQTYATQKVLENLGCQVEFVDYWRKNQTNRQKAEQLLESMTLKRFQKLWGTTAQTREMTVSLLEWMLKFRKMPTRKFLEETVTISKKAYYSFEELKRDPPQADIYITGSDQVWNSIWNQGLELPLFLEYAPEGKKRIAFAASIGRTNFDTAEIPATKELLAKYSAISVREQSAVDLLAQIGIPAEPILDPTLMLDADQWKQIATFHKKRQRPYLLIYQLNPNPDMDKYAEQLAKRKGYEIIRIGYSHSARKKVGHCVMRPSVSDFLGYFVNAQCILTDSFHATAFSLNLGKRFIVILPSRFATRIESILQLTGTQSRQLVSYDDFDIAEKDYDIQHVQNVLKRERERGFSFLANALK